jgi:ribulose-phosphate 3-epimerase
MGVSSSVSGSYLFNAASVGNALMNLTSRAIESHYLIQDFMVPLAESPVIQLEKLDFLSALKSIELGAMGFTIVVSENNRFEGIISNADIRRSLIKDFEKLPHVDTKSLVNSNAVCINENQNVVEMLQLVKKSKFPIMYLPVVNDNHEAVGMISFINLIKGEL